MQDAITSIHVFFGALAFAGALGAIATRIIHKDQRLHRIAGRTFTVAMLGTFFSALAIVSFSFNLFLTLVAVFSVYLALSGYLIARNRQPQATAAQKLLSGAASLIAVGMLAAGARQLIGGDSLGSVLIAFGLIMGSLSAQDIRHYLAEDRRADLRIAAHLSRMLGGTIAILTASTVVNLELNPPWLAWLLPTIVLAPVIIGWNVKLRRGLSA